MVSKLFFLPKPDGSQTAVIGPSSQPKSILDSLTSKEQKMLSDWSATQTGDPKRGGLIDLMQWPGWKDVMGRRYKELSGIETPAGD